MVIMYFVFENTNTSILFLNTLLAMYLYLYLYFKYKCRKYLYFVFKYFLKVFDRTLTIPYFCYGMQYTVQFRPGKKYKMLWQEKLFAVSFSIFSQILVNGSRYFTLNY